MSCCEQLDICLQDPATVTCLACDEARALRCIALAKLRELTCMCMSTPVVIGEVRYASPVEAIRELRQLIQLTFAVCENEALEEGPVMETVWENRCGSVCSGTCDTYDDCGQRFHSYTGCDGECS